MDTKRKNKEKMKEKHLPDIFLYFLNALIKLEVYVE